MYTTDSKNAKTCWRCRKCGFTTSLDESICSNPSCRADLSLYGEPFTPATQQESVREGKKEEPAQPVNTQQSSSNLWEEASKQEDPKKKVKTDPKQDKKALRQEKKVHKKQQAEMRAKEVAAQRSYYNRSPVKTFFLSVLIILVSLVIGIIVGYIPVLLFFEQDYSHIAFYMTFPWYAVAPGLALVVLSVLFARFSLRNKEDRKPMYLTIGLWLIPFVVSSWRKFFLDGGDSSEMYSVYLFLLFIAEPVLVGSTFSGVKGLRRASSILRWIGILLLGVSGILAVILTINTYFAHIL